MRPYITTLVDVFVRYGIEMSGRPRGVASPGCHLDHRERSQLFQLKFGGNHFVFDTSHAPALEHSLEAQESLYEQNRLY
jgi:hypothetical protein